MDQRAAPANLTGDTVTFAWTGAMGARPSRQGNFTISIGGKTIADFDAVMESTEFPCHAKGCRFLYHVLFTYNAVDSSGHFYLTVPKTWLTPGKPALLKVTGKDVGLATWFALVRAEDAPLALPARSFQPFVKVASTTPGTPPRAGTEATYEWYLKQYEDPGIFTPIGPPADPAETAVSPHGELMYANDRHMAGTGYVANALVFGLYDGGRVVPIGSEVPAQQVLADGYLPIVTTRWRYHGLDVDQTAFARPLRGAEYTTGMESTLAWARFDLTNRTAEPREITFLAAQLGDEKHPKRQLAFRDGVVTENGSARLSGTPCPGVRPGVSAGISRQRALPKGQADRRASPGRSSERVGDARAIGPRPDGPAGREPGFRLSRHLSLEVRTRQGGSGRTDLSIRRKRSRSGPIHLENAVAVGPALRHPRFNP